MAELKPLKKCPFCGGEAELVIDCDHHGEFYNLGCTQDSCIAKNVFYTVPSDEMPIVKAIKAWNKRATND